MPKIRYRPAARLAWLWPAGASVYARKANEPGASHANTIWWDAVKERSGRGVVRLGEKRHTPESIRMRSAKSIGHAVVISSDATHHTSRPVQMDPQKKELISATAKHAA